MKRILACLLLAALTSPTGAGEMTEYAFAQDGIILEIDAGQHEYVSLTPPPEAMFGPIATGGLNVELFADPMSKLQETFGGTIQSFDNYGYHTDWLCYTDGVTRTWFLTGERYDDRGASPVDWIVAEPADPTYDAQYGCSINAAAMLAPQDFPTLGTTRDELGRHFGQPVPAGTNRVVYFLQEDFDSYSLVRTAYFRLDGDVVDALSFSQWDSR